MKINSFEDVISWQKARVLNKAIYTSFNGCKDYSFRDQIQRASVSIMNNIAEGFERETKPELIRFLFISKGSCGEVKSMIILAHDLGYLTKQQLVEYAALTTEISKLLYGLIKSLK